MSDEDKPVHSDDSKDQSEPVTDAWTQAPEAASAKDIPSASTLTEGVEHKDKETEGWERDVINRLTFAALNEQRRSRRWNVFFKSLLFIYFAILLFYVPSALDTTRITHGKHTALIDVEGVIAADQSASADNIISGLRAAFKDKNTKGVILRINSPGGSPVQSGYINDEIVRLREKYKDIKLYVVITDICASGGYYIAAAADEIYANKASIVGSIGVLMDGFGFVGAMEKLGIERRLFTAGENKGALDPFSPVKAEEQQHIQTLLNGIHKQFIDVVKRGRKDRLKDSPKLFSGLFWDGEESVKLGLVDGLGSSSYVAREIIGAEDIVNFTPRVNYLDRFAERLGVSMANVMSQTLGLKANPGPRY